MPKVLVSLKTLEKEFLNTSTQGPCDRDRRIRVSYVTYVMFHRTRLRGLWKWWFVVHGLVDIGRPRERFLAINSGTPEEQAGSYGYFTQYIVLFVVTIIVVILHNIKTQYTI